MTIEQPFKLVVSSIWQSIAIIPSLIHSIQFMSRAILPFRSALTSFCSSQFPTVHFSYPQTRLDSGFRLHQLELFSFSLHLLHLSLPRFSVVVVVVGVISNRNIQLKSRKCPGKFGWNISSDL